MTSLALTPSHRQNRAELQENSWRLPNNSTEDYRAPPSEIRRGSLSLNSNERQNSLMAGSWRDAPITRSHSNNRRGDLSPTIREDSMFSRNISNEQGLDRRDRNAGDYAYPGRTERENYPRQSDEQGLDRWDRNAGDYAYPGRVERANPPHQTESRKATIVKVALISIGVLAILYLAYTIGHSDGRLEGRLEGWREGFKDGREFENEHCTQNCTKTIQRMESDRNRITRYDDFWLY